MSEIINVHIRSKISKVFFGLYHFFIDTYYLAWEELNVKLNTERLKYYCHITAPAYGESSNIIMEQDCFLYELTETIEPNNEISEVKFFDFKMYQSEPAQVLGVLKVFDKLAIDNLIL